MTIRENLAIFYDAINGLQSAYPRKLSKPQLKNLTALELLVTKNEDDYMDKKTGAQAFVEVLKKEKNRFLFGLPGGTEIPILDLLLVDDSIEYILGLHESCVVGMADGYARASRSAAVASVHSSVGTANSISGLYNSYRDGIPLVLVACDVDARIAIHEPFLWTRSLVETVQQFTKYSIHVNNAADIPIALSRALRTALTPPTGPTFLTIPTNILTEQIESSITPPRKTRTQIRARADPTQMIRAVDVLSASKAPVILAGYEISKSNAFKELREIAELLHAPVFVEPFSLNIVSPQPLAHVLPTDHPLYAGVFHSKHELVQTADVILGVGCRMFMFAAYPPPSFNADTRIIHVSENVHELGKNLLADILIMSDVKLGLKDLIAEFRTRAKLRPSKEREKAIAASRERLVLEHEAAEASWVGETPVTGPQLMAALRSALDDKAIIVDEAIRFQSYFELYNFREPDTFIGEPSGGALGWGVPAAIGVKLAKPERNVVAVIGDGSFAFAVQGLWTASKYNIPVVYVVCNNAGYAAEKALFFNYNGNARRLGKYIGCDIENVNYAKVAEGFGVKGAVVERATNLTSTLKNALARNEPYVIDVQMDRKDTGFRGPKLP